MTDIQRVYLSHTLNSVALSVISVYVPAYLLTLGYPLERVILYFAIAPTFGLLLTLFIYVPLMRKWGLINIYKLHFPLKILELLLLFLLGYQQIPLEIIALVFGAANFAYWIPLNLLFIRHSDHNDMASNLAKFHALPQLFGIIGPLIGAAFVPFIGFWPVFIITIIGLTLSYIPLAKIQNSELTTSLNFSKAWNRISKNRSLFLFEFFDNVLEESHWFWGIYVFIIIGSLTTPGIVGSLEAVGGAVFTFIIGKYANRNDKKIIPIASILFLIATAFMIFVKEPLHAYILTVAVSFVFTLFIVSYFSTIYKTIKGEGEEEFIILREIPTVLGRLVVFASIYLTISNLQYFFITPIIFTILLLVFYYWKKKTLYVEIKHPQKAYIFDIDGVLTNPENSPLIKTETFDALTKLIKSGVVCFNTGQSLSFVVREILEPLEAKVQNKKDLHHLITIGEKGAVWLTYGNEGKRIEHANNNAALPQDFQNEIRELANHKPYSDIMFYDETKQKMVTVQIKWGIPFAGYKEHQGSFVNEANKLLMKHNLNEKFIVDPTRYSVDIENKDVGKAVGTNKIVELLKERGVEPEEFICFGDSISDYDMFEELKHLGKKAKFVFVGSKEHLAGKDLVNIIFTKQHLDMGTLEYLRDK